MVLIVAGAHMEDYYAKNEPKIERLFLLLQISLGLLALQAAALMFDLIS